MTAVRLAHFSDVHITTRPLGWQRRDWLSKRATGWFNLRALGRGHRFHQADVVLAELMRELRERQPDHVIFSGDATALGFPAEFARAAELIGMAKPDLLPGLAVPGNHDYYTISAAGSGLFERHFAPWQTGQRLEGAPYPFAQRVGPLWLIGVNSATGNRWVWDSAGGVDAEQLDRLERLLGSLEPGPRILVTHFPLYLASGARERSFRGLRNLTDFLAVARQGGVALWLHGHQHTPYFLNQPALVPFPVICTGSATQTSRWSYHEYTIDGYQLWALRRTYDPSAKRFVDREAFELQLRQAEVSPQPPSGR